MNCSYCDKPLHLSTNNHKNYKRRFCDMAHYHAFRKEMRPIEEHEKWQGGVSLTEAHRRWKKKNPQRMAHLKARRYARERGAEGSHTVEEWNALKDSNQNKCAICGEEKPLTKDHKVPLSGGGTDYIDNIQPLCRNCNSKKWKFNIYENHELLEGK